MLTLNFKFAQQRMTALKVALNQKTDESHAFGSNAATNGQADYTIFSPNSPQKVEFVNKSQLSGPSTSHEPPKLNFSTEFLPTFVAHL